MSSPDVNLNLNVRGMGQSATVAINDRSNALRKEGREVFKLGLGQSPFPVPSSVVAELQANAFQKDYLPVKGLRELRKAVADYHRRTQGMACDTEDVLIGPGSKELMFLLQLVYYGDLIIPTPAWVSYAPQANIIGRHIQWIHTEKSDQWRMTPAQLEAVCRRDAGRPRVLILNYPSNPTGATFSADQLQALAEVARRYKVVVLSDEIYGELHHEGRHVSIARFYPEGTIVSSGLSKWAGAGGWRLGTFAFPRSMQWLLEAMAAVASETYTSVSAPIQFAACRAFRGGLDIEKYLHHSRRILNALGGWCAARMEAAGVSVSPPDGGFYLFPDFSACARATRLRSRSSSEWTENLLEDTGVAILPGSSFGRSDEELQARLAYVDFDGGRALYASQSVTEPEALDEEFLRTFCPNVTNAIDRLAEWAGH
ncbi:MAG: aminotransferase class I/II-fold pyridoxal phosphate-dependent enzyme [Myxococcota bacterium]